MLGKYLLICLMHLGYENSNTIVRLQHQEIQVLLHCTYSPKNLDPLSDCKMNGSTDLDNISTSALPTAADDLFRKGQTWP